MVSILNRYVPGRVFVLVAAENGIIAASICAVASLRVWRTHQPSFLDLQVLQIGLLVALVCQLTFYYFDLYDLRSIRCKRQLLGRLLSACGVCCLVLAITSAVYPPLRMEAGIFEVTFTCVVLLTLLGRLSLEWINRWITTGEQIIVVGQGDAAVPIVREIKGRSDLNLVLLGVVAENESDARLCGSRHLGSIANLGAVLQENKPDRVVLAVDDLNSLPLDVLLSYRSRGLCVEQAAALFEKLSGRIPIETITPHVLLFSGGFRKQNIIERIVARTFSMLLAAFVLVLTTPLMLVTAILIRLESRGPILFRQQRVGRDGVVFDIVKFRSMKVDAETHTGPQWARVNDPRITRVGSVIRRLRIDELPQLVNVLVGNMSLVGPRPERPYFVDLLRKEVAYYDLRHSIRPGLTGWAQVSCPYGSSLEDAKLKLEFDLFYVKNASFAFDLAILFDTVRTVVLRKGR